MVNPNSLSERRKTNFVLWIPSDIPATPDSPNKPRLVLGKWDAGNTELKELVNEELKLVNGLWEISCKDIKDKIEADERQESSVYLYWFQVQDTFPGASGLVYVTDPMAYALDYRALKTPGQQPPQPAAAIWIDWDNNELLPCDHTAAQSVPAPFEPPKLANMPANNQIVIYEAPASFIRGSSGGKNPAETDIGTFSDVAGLLTPNTDGRTPAAPNIDGEPYLAALGVNVLELTPPADAKPPDDPKDKTGSRQEWGYRTAHYFAPDYQLGYFGEKSTAVGDLSRLVKTCHEKGIRFFADVVMAFGHDPYKHIAFPQFHIRPDDERQNPDSYQSDRDNELRKGWGGESWRYIKSTKTYDPETGQDGKSLCPASSFHLAHILRWISYYNIDGLRLDSIENVANRDFLKRVRNKAHHYFSKRHESDPIKDTASYFTVVGEELNVPEELIKSGTLDGYWNEEFQKRLRHVILGWNFDSELFGTTVNRIIDCRALGRGFERGTQAINYITSHDVEADRHAKERLFNYLTGNGVTGTKELKERTMLAFAMLMTSIGTPMIFTGEEFCDQQDREATHPTKQVDPVNFSRVTTDAWRREVFDCVRRLIKLRKNNPALCEDEVDIIHHDFDERGDGRKIMAWVRGGKGRNLPVVVLANFSGAKPDEQEYRVPNGWPEVKTWNGKEVKWREIIEGTGDKAREVPPEKVNKEPLLPWEVKVYESYVEDD